jgi:hypothetical protein
MSRRSMSVSRVNTGSGYCPASQPVKRPTADGAHSVGMPGCRARQNDVTLLAHRQTVKMGNPLRGILQVAGG